MSTVFLYNKMLHLIHYTTSYFPFVYTLVALFCAVVCSKLGFISVAL